MEISLEKEFELEVFFFNEILNEKNSCFNKRTSVNISRARVRVNQETSKIVISEIRIWLEKVRWLSENRLVTPCPYWQIN